MKLAQIQRTLHVNAAVALQVQHLMREAFNAGFEAGHYADPDPTVAKAQDADNAWNEWLAAPPQTQEQS